MKIMLSLITLVLLQGCESGGELGFAVNNPPASSPVDGTPDNATNNPGDASMPPNNPVQPKTACAPGNPVIELTGSVTQADAKTYQLLPFEVDASTTRVEVGYEWTDNGAGPSTPLTQTVFDLGLWDADGYRVPQGFRGWSGSRQGRLDQDQARIFVQADSAERGYNPGAIEPGTWYAELGIAAVGPQGADWRIEIACLGPVTNTQPAVDPVDPAHIANAGPGWYHGDFHMHGVHSNANAPEWDGVIQQAREAGLEFLMLSEYITGRHWDELGPVQRTHPDLLLWPGREVITYFGHVNTFDETRNVIEYRHGFEDVTIGEIQQQTKAAGGLFQVNHPTIFPGPAFENFCRGCEFTLGDDIDWSQVDTIEVVTGPVLATSSEVGLPAFPGQIQSPFVQTALDLWEDLLMQGHKITAVSGSDSKGVDDPADRTRKGYGSSATVVFAQTLSRQGLRAGIQAGKAYIKTRGKHASPGLEMTVTAGAETGTFGDVFVADSATLEVTVTGAQGQRLRILQNGNQVLEVPIISDPFTHSQAINRSPQEGPLGTFWRVETLDQDSLTTIGNPVFLR